MSNGVFTQSSKHPAGLMESRRLSAVREALGGPRLSPQLIGLRVSNLPITNI